MAARVVRPVTVMMAPGVMVVVMMPPAVPGFGRRGRRHKAERADAGEREQDPAHVFLAWIGVSLCGIRCSLNAGARVGVPPGS
jgi:hypothetical protein